MQCPKCGHLEDRVIDSRPLSDGAAIRRRRECLNCGHRYTTYEEIERDNLRVQKRDGRYEAFDRKKLLLGMEKASEKRPISRAVLERACERIIRELTEEYGEEFPSVAIGEKVMEKLRAIDEVAFVRFASVYRKFRDIREFVSEIENLKPYDRILSGATQPDLVE